MVIAAATGKLVLLGILLLNLFYFLRVDFGKHKKTILTVVMIFLLIITDLLWIAVDYAPSDFTYFALHLMGVCCIGTTAMFIAVSSNIRMRRVMRHDSGAAPKH